MLKKKKNSNKKEIFISNLKWELNVLLTKVDTVMS